jgi:uncharacterized protein (TIGR00288 family)
MSQPHAHLPRPAHKEPPAHAPNAALLIDFDNVTMGIRSDLQTELRRLLQSEIIRGKVAVQRAYADWRRYPQYIVPLSESSIDLIFAPAYGSNKKNATDIRMAIDALELVFTRPEIGTFILLSGDSDFSSLVLKLKEYGKYVIGVGIRESSSDLLIQNCDEYYSYNELAGFQKESDIVHERHDPWELVVEAVKQMTAHNDVMRSDRLKQVMQEIDPNFDEKDAGYSRFSKFVLEAARRGLIGMSRMDNGQFEISLGGAATAPAAQPDSPRREEAVASRRGSLMSDAFGLLKQALGRVGGEEPVRADQVRDAMNEMREPETAPVEARSFPRLLRQAHDAEIIDLSKDENGRYAVRLRPEDAGAAPAAPAASADAPLSLAQPEEAPPPPVHQPELHVDEEFEPPMPQSSAPPPPYSTAPVGATPGRSARFRRGSKGGPRPTPSLPKVGVVEVDAGARPRSEPAPQRSAVEGEPTRPVTPRSPEGERNRERGDRPRGGRGRRGGGRGGSGSGDRPEGSGGGNRERTGSGTRRGGRSASGRAEEHRDEPVTPREPRPAQSPRFGAEEPAPPPMPRPAPEPDTGGESFWSRVKRGLTGGT